jgi:hypothetical protein
VGCTSGGDADRAGVRGVCGFAGHRDWFLPDVKQLQSIVDYSEFNPSINLTLPGETAETSYWSSTSDASDPSFAWIVYFVDGSVDFSNKPNSRRVRAVRGGP